jgi:prepilin-type N-terminal cleavage/methylation domain-containing protein
MKPHKQYGMTLIELMVALAIGAFLMIGAITVFVQSRTTFRITESLARLQENARFAIDVLEPEIRMAHYWGLTTLTGNITNRGAPTAGNGPGPDTCGNNWTINLDEAVDGSNNSYGFGCAGTAPVEVNSDTLIVRRAGEDAETPPLAGANTLRIQTVRGAGPAQIFAGTTIPAGFTAATSETHRLFANGYYVSRTSTATVAGVNVVPSLRVWTLLADGTMQNQEVIAGVEDLQVQFGVDTDAPDTPDRGSIDRYVNVNDAMIDPTNAGFNPNTEILAVRIWVRVRAERAENGFTDTTNYVYADQNVGPFNDGFRRIVVSKTVYLRNARPNS